MIGLTIDTTKRCGTCARGSYRKDGMVACGAAVDPDAILGAAGANPIWAERKYSRGRIEGLATAIARAQKGLPPDTEADAKLAREPEGSDADCMHSADGASCKMWQAHPELARDDECWHDMTVFGSQYEQQWSENGKYRHRPLKLDFGERRFGEERGFGDWRPGRAP